MVSVVLRSNVDSLLTVSSIVCGGFVFRPCVSVHSSFAIILLINEIRLLYYNYLPVPAVIKYFSCSNQLSTKFQLLIETKMPTNKEVSCFKSLSVLILLINVKMPTIVGIFTFMSRINVVLS